MQFLLLMLLFSWQHAFYFVVAGMGATYGPLSHLFLSMAQKLKIPVVAQMHNERDDKLNRSVQIPSHRGECYKCTL